MISCVELKHYEEQIEKDLARTFPRCEQFQSKEGQMALKRVLLAFSMYDATLGNLNSQINARICSGYEFYCWLLSLPLQ